uniref:Uncharacterized protein n=1 Tax=Ditylenchus dipsaci TaxID=166011 RepID=A0A915DLB4_9BILA
MDDLFDAFETDNGSTVAIKQEQQLPSDNQNQAREISNQLLNRLSAGGKGDKRTLSMEVDESPLANCRV